MTRHDPQSAPPNAALFADSGDEAFLADTLDGLRADGTVLAISDAPGFLAGTGPVTRLGFGEAGLHAEPLEPEAIHRAIGARSTAGTSPVLLAVDMGWAGELHDPRSAIEGWGALAGEIAGAFGLPVLSVYRRVLLVEDLMQAAFRAHPCFAAPSGLHDNPYWLPPRLHRAGLDAQMAFLLGRAVPDYAGRAEVALEDRFAARGAAPDWLPNSGVVEAAPGRRAAWRIHCLGQLRVYCGGERIDWKIKGGAPKKTRTLFAYLLTCGETGAHADRLAELLWPGGGDDETKRARLHHTVAMLRKTLGDRDSVLRAGDYYRLNPPAGSWIDIDSFEQLCRRGVSLFRSGRLDETLQVYRAAERLYGGDLFQDLPVDYIDDESEDWVIPRRTWLAEMALKLQRDLSAVLRQQGRLRQALEHCQRAAQMDPASELANIEVLRVLHAQGRIDAVARQYRQFRKTMEDMGTTADGSEIQALYLALTSR